jgi:hypothetical protein
VSRGNTPEATQKTGTSRKNSFWTQPLAQGQAGAQKGAFQPEYLHGAESPAVPLGPVGLEGLGGEAPGEGSVVIDHLPAPLLKPEAGVHVLGHRLGGEPADLLERRPTQHGRAAAIHRRAQGILARLDHIEKQLLLLPGRLVFPVGGMLEGVQIVEVLVDLDDRHPGVLEEAEQPVDQIGLRHVVGVQGDNEISGAVAQGVIQVAGFGMSPVGAGQIAAAELDRQLPDLGAVSIVEQPGGVGVAHADRTDHRVTEQGHRLVVGRNEHIHRPPRRRGDRLVSPPPPGGQIEEQDLPESDQLGCEKEVEEPDHRRVHGVADPPGEIPERGHDGEHHGDPYQPGRTGSLDSGREWGHRFHSVRAMVTIIKTDARRLCNDIQGLTLIVV